MRRGHIKAAGALADADIPGCDADDEGKDDRSLTASDTKTRSLN